jgi:Family of unknown function (DUF5317)
VILFLLAAACLISVPISGGRLRRLGDLELRCAWAAPLALGLQVLIITVAPGGDSSLHAAAHLGTYGLGGLFLWANRHLRGSRLIATGAIANTVAIAANAGIMPASMTAQRIAGLATGTGFQNSAHLAHPHLLWLGDIIPVPGPLPLGNVLSIGDLVIYAGMLVLLHNTCRTPASLRLESRPTAERYSHRNH